MSNILNLKEKKQCASQYYRYFDAFTKISLADIPRNKMPLLQFSEDEATYTDGPAGVIVIGLSNPLYEQCEDNKDFVWVTQYLLGHEIQHVLSTPKKPWKWGIDQGVKLACQEISRQIEGPQARRFIKDSDYDVFIADMNARGIFISIPQIQKIVHFVQNSLCDGRIERLRSKKRPGFRSLMIASRGYSWKENEMQEKKNYDELSVAEKLVIKLNQILSLATTSLYMNGFLEMYGDTPLRDEVDELIPLIAKGVKAGNCFACMKQAVEIEKALISEIIEVCKYNAMDIVLSNISMPSEQAEYDGMSSTEEKGEGETENGTNDNEQEVDSSQKNNENDKANSEITDSDKKCVSGVKEKADADEEENGSSNSNDSTGVKVANNETSEGNTEKEISDNEMKKEKQATDAGQNAKCKNQTEANIDWGIRAGERNIGASVDVVGLSKEEIESCEKEIETAAKMAAEAARDNAETVVGAVPVQRKEREQFDTSQITTAQGIAEKYPDDMYFKENKREYELLYPLPVEVAGRAEKFAHDIERLLQNQKEPYVRGRMSGALDSGKISKLLMKQGDFYRKKGKIPEFNGCGYLLMDNSGSMGNGRGSKREYACEAMAVIEEGFKRYMPVKITAFDAAGYNYVSHEVVKGFDEKMNNSCSYNFFISGRTGNGNKDGFSIRVATKELLERPEKEKLLVVASDGTPSCYGDYQAGMADVRDAVKEARAAGIKVVGIFFANDYANSNEAKEFMSMYEYDCVCTTPELIEDELTKVMTRFMFG